MSSQMLVVSDPPLGTVDAAALGALLGLPAADAALKLAYPAPEVLSSTDPDKSAEVASAMESTGMSVVVVDSKRLAEIPWPRPASWFEFGPEALLVRTGRGDVAIRYDEPVVGVYCAPPPDSRPNPSAPRRTQAASPEVEAGLVLAESLEWMPHLDLYYRRDRVLQRVTLARDLVDFSGLRDQRGATGDASMEATVDECVRSFKAIELDRRLQGIRPRQRFRMGDPSFDPDLRKLFSYGTLLLRQMLDSTGSGLGDLTQFEFGSRLAYATSYLGRENV